MGAAGGRTGKVKERSRQAVAHVSPGAHPSPHPFPSPPRRKAYRLGKFLQNVHGLRQSALWRGDALRGGRTDALLGFLEVVTVTGEGVYYFIDQFIW